MAFELQADWVRRRAGSHVRIYVALTDGAEPLQKHMRAKLSGFTLVLDLIASNVTKTCTAQR